MFKEVKANIHGTARTTNPVATTTGDVPAFFDDVGRQVTYPYQIRDLIATAYVALSNGTETALLAGLAGEYHDLISISGANSSGASALIEIRASTAGTIIAALQVPANDTTTLHLPAPIPAPFADQAWTVDMADITGTTIRITALFIKNV